MRIKLLQTVIAGDVTDRPRRKGSVIETSEDEGRGLINIGYGKETDEELHDISDEEAAMEAETAPPKAETKKADNKAQGKAPESKPAAAAENKSEG